MYAIFHGDAGQGLSSSPSVGLRSQGAAQLPCCIGSIDVLHTPYAVCALEALWTPPPQVNFAGARQVEFVGQQPGFTRLCTHSTRGSHILSHRPLTVPKYTLKESIITQPHRPDHDPTGLYQPFRRPSTFILENSLQEKHKIDHRHPH